MGHPYLHHEFLISFLFVSNCKQGIHDVNVDAPSRKYSLLALYDVRMFEVELMKKYGLDENIGMIMVDCARKEVENFSIRDEYLSREIICV